MGDRIKLLDVVILIEDLPTEHLRKDTIGSIVEQFNDDTFLVEFADQQGKAYAFEELKSAQLLKVYYERVSVWN